MTRQPAVLIRCYLTESRSHVDKLIRRLQDTGEVSGITVLDARVGLGSTTPPNGCTDPPVIVEVFDTADRETHLVKLLRRLLAPRHILVLPATLVR